MKIRTMTEVNQLFIDTSYVLGLYNKGDQYHKLCVDAMSLAQKAREIYTTDAILMEIGNAFSAVHRRNQGSKIIRDFLNSTQIIIEHLTPRYFEEALQIYEQRSDKQWGMVDCFSFIVTQKYDLKTCLGTDHHFVQAGFKIVPL